jgi:hypothetical protein
MPEKEIPDKISVTSNRLICAGIYSASFLLSPFVLVTRKSAFKKFCEFHTRVLALSTKGPVQTATLSVLVSLAYSTIIFPVYYKGLLLIIGLNSIYDLSGIAKDATEKTIRKYPMIQGLEEKVIFELDKAFGIAPETTKKYVETAFEEKNSKKKPH